MTHGLSWWQRLFDFFLLGLARAQTLPLLGRQAGLAGLCPGKIFLRGCRFLRLRSPSPTPLRLLERLVELWITSVGSGASLWEFTLTAGDLSGRWRVWCVQTACRLVHASGRLLVLVALSQSRLLLQARSALLLASSGTLLSSSSDRGPISRAGSVDLQSCLASLGVINARSFPPISRRRFSSTSASTSTTTGSAFTRALSTSTCSLRSEGS